MRVTNTQATRRWHAPLPLLAGLCIGLTLARALRETWPLTFWEFPGWILGMVGAGLLWYTWHRFNLEIADFLPCLLPLLGLLLPVNILRLWTLLGGAALLMLIFGLRRSAGRHATFGIALQQRATIAALLVGAGVFGVYLLTLGRYVGEADTFEFQVTAPVLGVAHPTGYPLYILLGKLCSLVPFGSMAWRVNLSAAIPAALAVLVCAEVIRRLETGRLLAVLSALMLAFSPTFWSQAIGAEVYTLNALFVIIILGSLINALYRTDPRFGGQETMRVHSIWALALAFGLGLTNHLTLVLLLPAALLAMWICHPRLTHREWGIAAGMFGLGLLVYLYIPLRWPALHAGAGMPLDDFIAWVTGRRFGGALMWEYFSVPERWMTIFRLALDQFGVIGLALGLLGLARLARWFPGVGTVSLVAYGAYFAYALVYIIPDIGVFLIPMHIIQVIWIAYAVHAISEWAPKFISWLTWERIYTPLHTAVALIALTLLWTNGAAQDPNRGRAAEAWGRQVLSLPLDADSVILADSAKIAPLEYLHRVEGLRPDMEMIVLGNEALYRQVLDERLAQGDTVYLARYLPGLEGMYHLRSAGPLVEVGTAALTAPPADMKNLDIEFDGWAQLIGYRTDTTARHIGDTGRITLYWQRDGAPTGRYQVWLRLLDAAGTVVWQSRDRFAVNNTYPTNAWKEDEIIPDYHEVAFEQGIMPGTYHLEVGLFEPFAIEGLSAHGKEWAHVTTFEVALADDIPRPSVELRYRLSDALLLLGYDMPDVVAEGTPVYAKLHLLALADVENAQLCSGMMCSTHPANLYEALPPLQRGDRFVLEAKMRASREETQYIVGIPGASWLELPAVPTRPAAPEALANYDGRALLLDAQQSTTTLHPGEEIDVFLTWEVVQRFDDDYTVFVQLIGPDGLPHGQSDVYPVQGTYPTGAWQVGERINDAYRVHLYDDAPPGEYEILLGFYLLASGERLPIIDETGAPIANRYILGQIEVVGR